MNFLLAILSAGIGSGLMAILLAWLQRKWKKEDDKAARKVATDTAQDDRIDAMCEALKVLMVKEIRYIGTGHITRKEISLADKMQMQEMYAAYKRLPGANGHCTPVMEEVEKLPVTG